MTEEGASTTPHHYPRTLFNHTPHLHMPQNINLLFKAEQEAADFNSVWQ